MPISSGRRQSGPPNYGPTTARAGAVRRLHIHPSQAWKASPEAERWFAERKPLVVVLAREKAAVALVDQRGECLVRRAGGGGLKSEVLLGNRGRPGHRGVGHDPFHRELVRARIGHVHRRGIAKPTHVEGRNGIVWWRLGGPWWQEKWQRICQLAVVEEMQVLDLIPGALPEVVRFDAHPAVRDPNRPEQATGCDARAHVVNLMSVGRQRVYLTLIDVESDEAERPFVLLSVGADIFATHEPVVAVEEQRRRLSRLRIPSSAGAPHGGDARGAAIVEDRARLHTWAEE